MSDSKKLRLDFTADIEKLKNQNGREEEAVAEAKKLRGEIEHQMEKSFELIEESQNEVKGFLHKRQKEEEEHKTRAAEMVKRLENEIFNVEDDINDNVKNYRKHIREGIGLDSKSVQTDNTIMISKDSQTDESGTSASYSQSSGPWVGQQVNIDDIPDVIESIKEDLIENIKIKLADEEEKIGDDKEINAILGKQTTSNQDSTDQSKGISSAIHGMSEELPAKEFDRKLAELSKAVIENEIRREIETNSERDVDSENLSQNDPAKLSSRHLISNHRKLLQAGLMRNIHSINEVPGILLEEREDLKEAYNRMKKDFDRLKQLITEENRALSDSVGMEKIVRCRELCRDVDYIEGIIKELNNSIEGYANMKSYGDSLVNGMNDYNSHIEDAANVDQTSASSLVAAFKGIDKLDDMMYENNQIPAAAIDRQQLLALLEKKMDAKKKLDSKLDGLKLMLGQGTFSETRMDEGDDTYVEDESEKLSMDPENLRLTTLRLQKELDMLYKANNALMDENAELCEDKQDLSTGKGHKIENIMQQIGYLDVPRWESGKKIKENLNELKKMIGEDIYKDLLNGIKDEVIPYRELKDYESMRMENRNLKELLNEYRDDIKNVTERLINANITNDINEVVKVDSQNIKRITDDLQRKATETEEMIVENGLLLKDKESVLNALAVERKVEVDEEDKLLEDKLELEKQLALTNKSIHEFFPWSEIEKLRGEIERKMKDIDKEIDIIARELKEESEEESDEKKAEIKRLEKLLEKLKPHVKNKVPIINVEEHRVHDVPEEFEVDKVIKMKEDLERRISENNNVINEQSERSLDGAGSYSKNSESDMNEIIPIAREGYAENLQQLKEELKDNMEKLENAEFGKDDTVYLKEVVESLKTSLEETNKDLEDAQRKFANSNRVDEELDETEKKIEYLTEILDDKEKGKSKDEKLKKDSAEAITQYNVKETVGKASERLKEEKRRLEMIIESTKNLERERSISTITDFSGFQKSFCKNTENIKTDIDECMDDVIRILNASTVQLQSTEAENMGRKDNVELTEQRNKLTRLKGSMAELYRDFQMMERFEKEGETGEILDSDIEELVYKIEAIKVSIERMDKTIEEHLESDGDAKTLEILGKRRTKMKDSQNEAMGELSRRREVMKRELRELMREKVRVTSEMKQILGTGRINNDVEKLAMLELIEDIHFCDLLEINEDGGELHRYVTQRQKIAEEYKEFIGLGVLTEEDGEFLSSMIDSVEVDIQERLGEIFSDCKDYNDDFAYEKKYLNAILSNRSELKNALYELEKLAKEDWSGIEFSKEIGRGEKSYKSTYMELRELANNKLNVIEAKLDRLDDISSQPAFSGSINNNIEGSIQGDYEHNRKEVEEMIQLIRDECSSLEIIDRLDEDWNGITASLLDEMNMKTQIDHEINKLFDEREELMSVFLETKSSGVDLKSDDTVYFDQITNVDQRILDQKKLYVEIKPTVYSSPTIVGDDILFEQEDQQDNLLQSFFDERDFTLRQLFALKTRESVRRYNKDQTEAVEQVSSLRGNLESALEKLDTRIKGFGDNSEGPALYRTQSPNVYAMMLMIEDEAARLREEVNGNRLFLYEKVGTEERKDDVQNNRGESKEEQQAEIKDKIRVLKERREYLILAEEEQQDSMSVEDIFDKKAELEGSLKELQSKLAPLERVAQLEKEIEDLERRNRNDSKNVEDLNEENIPAIDSNTQLQLDDVKSTISRYAAVIENELSRRSPLTDSKMSSLNPDDVEQVRDILKHRLDELINERMKLNFNRQGIPKDFKDESMLQKLVDKRKEILRKLDDVESEIKTRSFEQSLAKELHEERQKYEAISQRQNFLEKKKNELENAMRYLVQQKDVSFEDTTSGFSDNVEVDERNKEMIYEKEKEISNLKQEIETLALLNEKHESELEEKQEKITELIEENSDKNESINKLEEELIRLQKEVNELNEAAEAMMEVANAMEEQIHEKSLEIELNRDEIKELQKQLREAEARDWHGMEAKYDELDAMLKDKSKEMKELINEKVAMNQELECLNEKIAAINDELSSEKAKCMNLEEQINLLDQLKDELKRKGKRILKIDNDELYTMSPTEEDVKDESQSNDFKNEIDKVSAVEEIMKLAAEMTSENETRARQCSELETQKEELTQILDDLLEKCQSQNEEIESLKRKMKETGGVNVIAISPDGAEKEAGIDKEEDIVPVEHRILLSEPDKGLKDDIDDLKTRVTILSNEKEQLKDELEDARFKIDGLEEELKSMEKMLNSAESQIEELMGTVRTLLAKNNDLEAMRLKEEQLRQKLELDSKEKIRKRDEGLLKEKRISAESKRRAENAELEKQGLVHEMLLKSTKNDHLSKQITDLEQELEDAAKMFNGDKRKFEKQRKMLMDEKEDIAKNLKDKCDEISNLKTEVGVIRMNYERIELASNKEIKLLKMQIQAANDHGEELQKNFDRMKRAKEKMLIDYEKQIKSLLEEIANLKSTKGKLSYNLEKREATSTLLIRELEKTKEELIKDHRKELKETMKNKDMEVENEENKRRKVEEDLEKERYERKKQQAIFQEADDQKDVEIDKLNEKVKKLQSELQQKDYRIGQLESTISNFEDLEKQASEDSDIKFIRRNYEKKLMKLRLDLEEAQHEGELLLERNQKLKKLLTEKEFDLSHIESEYQNEVKDMKKKLMENEIRNEKEKSKGAEMDIALKNYKEEYLAKSAFITELYEEKVKLNKDLKELEKIIRQMKERNDSERRNREIRNEELENQNEKLIRKIKNIEKELISEIEESNQLKSVKKEIEKVKDENLAYKEKILEMDRNHFYKEKAERLETDLKSARDDFEAMKNESVQILRHSNAMKNEVKHAKHQLEEMKKDHKKENKLLVSNLEKEFRKKIEEIIKSNLQEKEKMLQMWDEERENWEAELKEDLESSKYELERQLRLQKSEIEREHMNKLTEVMNENNSIVNDLNARLNELDNERKQMEQKLDQEIRSTESNFAAEKEYMVVMIRELLKSLVDSKSRKTTMSQNYKSEITNIEEKFEKEKLLMNMQLTEELNLLRNKVNKMVNREHGVEDLLDIIPRKLQ